MGERTGRKIRNRLFFARVGNVRIITVNGGKNMRNRNRRVSCIPVSFDYITGKFGCVLLDSFVLSSFYRYFIITKKNATQISISKFLPVSMEFWIVCQKIDLQLSRATVRTSPHTYCNGLLLRLQTILIKWDNRLTHLLWRISHPNPVATGYKTNCRVYRSNFLFKVGIDG